MFIFNSNMCSSCVRDHVVLLRYTSFSLLVPGIRAFHSRRRRANAVQTSVRTLIHHTQIHIGTIFVIRSSCLRRSHRICAVAILFHFSFPSTTPPSSGKSYLILFWSHVYLAFLPFFFLLSLDVDCGVRKDRIKVKVSIPLLFANNAFGE